MKRSLETALALSCMPGVGRVRLRALLAQLAPKAETELTFSDVTDELREELPAFSSSDLSVAQAESAQIVERCESIGIAVHPFAWPTYPTSLRRLPDPPALLFSIGPFTHERRPRIAVIGTRHPTPWGLKTAEACATKIAASGSVVVSGLALGVDSEAHRATVDSGGITWAVLAHGLHTISPAANKELARHILETGGSLISEYAPGQRAQRHYFVERDRIQAGLSDAVLIVESSLDGGAMHTVKFARQAKIPVWVTVPEAALNSNAFDLPDIPESQQGTWELFRTQAAARVSTPAALNAMILALSA